MYHFLLVHSLKQYIVTCSKIAPHIAKQYHNTNKTFRYNLHRLELQGSYQLYQET